MCETTTDRCGVEVPGRQTGSRLTLLQTDEVMLSEAAAGNAFNVNGIRR